MAQCSKQPQGPEVRGHPHLNQDKARMDRLCTTAFTNELLILPANVSSEQQQLYTLSFVLFFQVVQPQYFQRNQDTSDLQKFSKVSMAERTRGTRPEMSLALEPIFLCQHAMS